MRDEKNSPRNGNNEKERRIIIFCGTIPQFGYGWVAIIDSLWEKRKLKEKLTGNRERQKGRRKQKMMG